MRPQKSDTLFPEGPLRPTIFDVSASIVAGPVGWNESFATVTAPPRMLVSLPPLDVVRVAHPEVNAERINNVAARRTEIGFMGQLEERRTVGSRRKFRKTALVRRAGAAAPFGVACGVRDVAAGRRFALTRF